MSNQTYKDIRINEARALAQNLTRPETSRLHQAIEAWPNSDLRRVWADAQVILVDYDAYRLMAEKVEMTDGDEAAPLPFGTTAFEFIVDGNPAIVVRAFNAKANAHELSIARRLIDNWTLVTWIWRDGNWVHSARSTYEAQAFSSTTAQAIRDAWLDFALNQTDAVCWLIDVHLFDLSRTPGPEKLNAQRVRKGRLPLYDFHTLTLRGREDRTAVGAGGDGGQLRLHIRRGHTHTFHTKAGPKRQWVKSMWVGNPDLGFVDKQYRLGVRP